MKILRFAKILGGITLLFTFLSIGRAQSVQSGTENNPFKIQRVNGPVKLDGLSDEAAWDGIVPLPLVMTIPNFGSEPSELTELILGYDDDYLYAAGRFFDSEPSLIQATSFKRDVWTYTTDGMNIILDPFNDNENSVSFFTTPAGTRTDVNFKNDAEGSPFKNMNRSWDAFWDVETVINDEGWFAEMRIPFSSLRFEEKDGQVIMGLTAYRWIARNYEMNTFPVIPERFGFWGTFKPSQTQQVLFEGIKPHNPLYITPYLLGGLEQSTNLNDAGTTYERDNRFTRDIGLDVKYGLTNNLTLDVTINTDFAQVEADDQQINLTRFSLFFPEKRRFFQERQGAFEFKFEDNIGGVREDDNRLFYSRRIGLHKGEQVRIYGGARVVGRAGPWDIGFLNMQTEKHADLPSENFNVIRLRRQVMNPYSYIGGMVTSRIGNNNLWNTAYGIDGIFRLFGDDYLSVKWAQSFENDKPNNIIALDPSIFYVNWNRRGDEGLGYNLSFSRSGDDFNPGIGYVRRNNYTRLGDRVQYGWFPGEASKLNNHRIFVEGITYINNTDGRIESSEIGPGWDFTTDGGTAGSISFRQSIENVITPFSLSADAHVPSGRYAFYGIRGYFYSPQSKRILPSVIIT